MANALVFSINFFNAVYHHNDYYTALKMLLAAYLYNQDVPAQGIYVEGYQIDFKMFEQEHDETIDTLCEQVHLIFLIPFKDGTYAEFISDDLYSQYCWEISLNHE